MGKRSLITKLPTAVRDELDQKLIAAAFGAYVELSVWLKSLGHDVSKSSVHRYGAKLERKLQSWRSPVTPVQRIDQAIKAETTRVQQAKIRQDTGVIVIVIDPPTRETILYATAHSAARTRELIEGALFNVRTVRR